MTTKAKPNLQQQIEFVRGARHLVAKNNEVLLSAQHKQMLMEIEENLLAVKLFEKGLKKTIW